MVISFNVVTVKSMSTLNVLRRQELWRDKSVQKFFTSQHLGFAGSRTGTSQHWYGLKWLHGVLISLLVVFGVEMFRWHWNQRGFVCLCVERRGCYSPRMTVAALWSIGCNQPPPAPLTTLIGRSVNFRMDQSAWCQQQNCAAQTWNTKRIHLLGLLKIAWISM